MSREFRAQIGYDEICNSRNAPMPDADRAELLAGIDEILRLWPEMRVGQLIANLAVVAHGTEPSAVWDMEDDELLAAVRWQLAELRERQAEVA